MSVFDWVFVVYCISSCVIWLSLLGYTSWVAGKVPVFDSFDFEEPKEWPVLSIIIAACNEESTIESALKTLLHEDYPCLEIICINDRSTDQTGNIINRMAELDHRLKSIHVSELPEGWLGKVHALHLGSQQATGQFLLYTDADIHFMTGTLQKAVAHMISRRLDHFTILPVPISPSFLFEVVLNTFGGLFMLLTRVHQIETVGSTAFTGCGAFNLVRKTKFDETPGFSWLKMEVGDDVALGLMMKKAGSRSSFAITEDAISVTWYRSMFEMFQGLEKNSFAIASQFKFWLMLLQIFLLWAFVAAPVLSIVFNIIPMLWVSGGLVGLALMLRALSARMVRGAGLFATLLMPLGCVFLSLILLRSGVLCVLRGGIIWRGTFYSTECLKKGQRLRAPFL